MLQRTLSVGGFGARVAAAFQLMRVTAAGSQMPGGSVFAPAAFVGQMRMYQGGSGVFGAKESRHGQRITQEERRKKLQGRSPDEKRAAAQALEDADEFITRQLPDDLQSLLDKKVDAANIILTKLTNPAVALERVEVELNGVKRPLLQLATVLKVSSKELSITPHDHAHTVQLINRLNRHDHTLMPTRNGEKIRVTVEPVTKQRRETAAAEIVHLRDDLTKKYTVMRRNAINYIAELKIANRDTSHDLEQQIHGMCEEKIVEGEAKLQEMADEALSTELDDETDAQQAV